VFIDETAVTTKMVRHYGRSPRGQRLIAKVPHGHWKTLTLIAALRIDGLTAPYVVDGAMDGPSFLAYVEQVLAPTLRKGDIVLMDNLRTHKIDGVRQAVVAAGARLRYLPAYSPDLNPIEQVFSNSRPCCAKPTRAPPRRPGGTSARSSIASRPRNAPIISSMPDMLRPNRIRL